MRGISVLLFLVGVTVARGQVNECPAEQETNWEIEHLLHHEDCHKFYKCTYGQPVEYICPSDLYFNLDKWACDWSHNVDCEGRNDPALTTVVPDTPKPTTPEPTTPEPITPEPTTSEPTAHEPTTPESTTFEPTTTEPTTLAPTTSEPTTPETITPEPTTPESTTPEPTTPGPATPEPATPEPTTPEPTTTTTTKKPECEVEVWPQPEPQPELQPEPQPQPQPESQPPTEVEVDFLLNGCPVDPHIHWLLPHAEDCTLFYYCVWGELVLRECPGGLHFNPVIQVCDWPTSAGCSISINKHAEARRHLLNQMYA